MCEPCFCKGSNDDEDPDDRDADLGNWRMRPSGNLSLPFPKRNVVKIPADAINISEEMNKSGVWKQVSSSEPLAKDKEKDNEYEKSST